MTWASFGAQPVKQTGIPGGVVEISVPKTNDVPPNVRFGLSEVAVIDRDQRWLALIGLDLKQLPGEYIVYVRQAESDEPAAFVAFEVLHNDYNSQVTRSETHATFLPPSINIETLSVLDFTNSQPPTFPFSFPVDSDWQNGFGSRAHENSVESQVQVNYITTDAPMRALIRAPQRGIVSNVIQNGPSNATVVLDHGQNVFSVLHGLDELAVEIGNGIEANAVIAKVPATQNALQPPSVIWQVSMNGAYVDPELLSSRIAR